MTYRDLITDSLIEINAIGAEDTPSASDLAIGKKKLNYLLNEWAARKRFVFSDEFLLFTFTPNLAPHTIGPTGTFVVPQRPVEVISATVLLGSGTTTIDLPPVEMLDDEEWANVAIKGLPSTFPTALNYSADWPNGILNWWPVPQSADQVRMQLRTLISQVSNIDATVSYPQGYEKALMQSLAEELCSPFEKTPSNQLMKAALSARNAVFGNNNKSPKMNTNAAGMSENRTPRFNYLTREPW